MAQDISKLNNGGKSAPEKKQVAKIDAHAHKKLLWSNISKKFLLPASILFLAAGLFLTVFYVLQLLQVIPQSEAMTLGMKISSIVLGVFLIVTGVFGLMDLVGLDLMPHIAKSRNTLAEQIGMILRAW